MANLAEIWRALYIAANGKSAPNVTRDGSWYTIHGLGDTKVQRGKLTKMRDGLAQRAAGRFAERLAEQIGGMAHGNVFSWRWAQANLSRNIEFPGGTHAVLSVFPEDAEMTYRLFSSSDTSESNALEQGTRRNYLVGDFDEMLADIKVDMAEIARLSEEAEVDDEDSAPGPRR